MDFLKSAVASAIAKSSSFPYTIGDRVDLDASIWTLSNAVKKDDNSPCSVFTFDIAAQRSFLPLAKNAARKLRTIRHPGVIKVLDVIENETHIYIATEKVSPLSWHVKRKSLSEETIKWGLYTVSNTLKFINSEASSIHGSVRVGSVYTSDSGEWKLAGFEVLSSMNEDEAVIYNYGSLVPDANRYAPPEIAGGGWSVVKKNPLYAPDSYGLGTLIYEAFNRSMVSTDRIGQPGKIPSSMTAPYKRLINTNPKLRLSAAHFVEQGKKSGGFFETPLIHITEGAESLGLKNETERDEFLNDLEGLTDDFPEDFFKVKILPELLKSVEFGGGGPKVFAAIVKIGSKMSRIGIGAAVAENLAAKGSNLLLIFTSDSSAKPTEELCEKLQAQHGIIAKSVQADLSEPSRSVPHILATAKNYFSHPKSGTFQVDILINNAGIAGNKTLNDPEQGPIEETQFHKMYNVNVLAPLLLTQAVAPFLPKDRSGRIVNVSSVSSSIGYEGQSIYAGTKAALEAMTRTWSRELAENATVNAVNPGPVWGDMYAQAGKEFWAVNQKYVDAAPLCRYKGDADTKARAGGDPDEFDKIVNEGMGGMRPGFTDDIAATVGMLCSDECRWTTGSVVCANGGMRMSIA